MPPLPPVTPRPTPASAGTTGAAAGAAGAAAPSQPAAQPPGPIESTVGDHFEKAGRALGSVAGMLGLPGSQAMGRARRDCYPGWRRPRRPARRDS